MKATYERLAKKGSASLAGVRLEIINGYQEVASGAAAEMSGLQVVDDHRLQITLREPYVQLPELLASPLYGIVPKAVGRPGRRRVHRAGGQRAVRVRRSRRRAYPVGAIVVVGR